MIAALTWLTGSRVGRWVVVGAILAVAVWFALRAARLRGRDEARADAMQERMERTVEVLDAVRRMGQAQAAGPRDRRAVFERLLAGNA